MPTYYIATDGDDGEDGLTEGAAWLTFNYAINQLVAGDTLYLMDGTFTDNVYIDIAGEEGSPITFIALNDGEVTVDAEQGARTLHFDSADYIDVQGIIFRNGSFQTCMVNLSDYINVRRCSFYDATEETDDFSATVNSFLNPTNVLFEDCVFRGKARAVLQIAGGSFVTYRRCYSEWWESSGGAPYSGIVIYPGNDNLIENCVSRPVSGSESELASGFSIGSNTPTCDRNRIYGCVAVDFQGAQGFILSSNGGDNIVSNEHRHCIAIRTVRGFYQRADDSWTGENLTLVGINTTDTAYGLIVDAESTQDPDFECNGDLKNSSLLTGVVGLGVENDPAVVTWTHTYNSFYDFDFNYALNASEHASEFCSENANEINPNYDTATYGDGAYLMIPTALQGQGESGADIGAEVLYRYKDAELTDIPLWPWPMEDRIFAEIGVSVTYSEDQGGGETGGLFKTLDGVYPVAENESVVRDIVSNMVKSIPNEIVGGN